MTGFAIQIDRTECYIGIPSRKKEEEKMITLETARCPRCGSKYGLSDSPYFARLHDRDLSYYGECDCGAGELTVRNGEVIRIRPCAPYEDDSPICFPDPYEQEFYA